MIGYFNYSEILTYLSAISAGVGIIVALQGNGHPYLGVFFLLFCGLCDAFDGKVARMKKKRQGGTGTEIWNPDRLPFGSGCIRRASGMYR